MRVIRLSATAGADGHLRLDIPVGTAGGAFEVAVVLHPAANGVGSKPTPELMRTCGAIDDDTFDTRRLTDLPQTEAVE